MGVSLAPDTTTPVDPTKPKAPAIGLAPSANLTAAGTPATAPLPTEYPSAPSTTGTPQNRLDLATSAFDTFAKSTAPQYTADLREATQRAAGAGNIGSGMLRTTYGNLANQRALALDTERSNLINSATTATIADQQANRGLDIQQQNADTSRTGTLGNLGVAQGSLGLETKKADTAANQGQQALDIQKQQADIQAKVASGQLSVAEGQLELAKLSQATSAGQTQQQIDLQAKKQANDAALAQAGLTGIMADGTQTLAAKQAAIQNALEQGRLTNEQAQTAIQALSEKDTAANQAGQLQLAHQQLEQAGTQFGLSQAQNLKLAQLADATQNRQIDVNTQQGQNQLLLQLASIIGGPQGSLDPNFVATIMKALGFAAPAGGGGGTTGTGTGSGGGASGGTTDGGTGGGDTRAIDPNAAVVDPNVRRLQLAGA
jgi:hypothetical protein